MTASGPANRNTSRVLRHFDQGASCAPREAFSSPFPAFTDLKGRYGLSVSVWEDLEAKKRAMELINRRLFVSDADEPRFVVAQQWIEECGRQVALPRNFCGGLLIMRLYRLMASPSEQHSERMAAVHAAAAAYDFAFLALGHADDEADMTLVRNDKPTRFVTHPATRAVDGINLLLSGLTAMQEVLNRWPCLVGQEGTVSPVDHHPFTVEIMEALTRALKEASFPILLDRTGFGHASNAGILNSGLDPIQVDSGSIGRIAGFTRYRAHTYFMRATVFASLLALHSAIGADLSEALDKLFSSWGYMGAAADDLQDVIVDFSAGVHSICTVMAHLCVAEDAALRPEFRRALPAEFVQNQRQRLGELFGNMNTKFDTESLLGLLNEVGLREALTAHLEESATLLASSIYDTVVNFGFDPRIIIDIASVVCDDPDLAVPEIYLSALATVRDHSILKAMYVQGGTFIALYLIDRFWPRNNP